MDIGRARRREHPNQHFVQLLLEKIQGEKVREKKRGKKSGRATSGQGLFRSRDCHFRSKGLTRADIAQLPVAHAQNILPDRARDWRHFRSRHFRSCAMVRSSGSSTNTN